MKTQFMASSLSRQLRCCLSRLKLKQAQTFNPTCEIDVIVHHGHGGRLSDISPRGHLPQQPRIRRIGDIKGLHLIPAPILGRRPCVAEQSVPRDIEKIRQLVADSDRIGWIGDIDDTKSIPVGPDPSKTTRNGESTA